MRISNQELALIKKLILTEDPKSKIYLFGSRLEDNKKGGDIDILVLSNKLLTHEQKSKIRWGFFEKFGEQKFDIVNFLFKDNTAFKELVLLDAVEL